MTKQKNKSKAWWAYLILGIIVLVCGGNFLATPIATLTTISFFTGLYFLLVGITTSVTVFIERKVNKKWILYLLLNMLLIIVGALMISKLRFTITYLWLITGLGFIVEAFTIIIKSIDFKKTGDVGWIYMIIFGILVGFFGLIVLFNPLFGLNFITTIVAAGVICFGIYLIVISIQLKPLKHQN